MGHSLHKDKSHASIFAPVVLGCFGFLLGYLILPLGCCDIKCGKFITLEEFTVWRFFFSCYTCLILLSAPYVYHRLRELREHWVTCRAWFFLGAISLLALVGIPAMFEKIIGDSPLPHHWVKTTVPSIVGFILAMSAGAVTWLVGIAMQRRQSVNTEFSNALSEYLAYRSLLHNLLWVVSGLAITGLLATAALRSALIAFPGSSEPELRRIIVWGLFYSLVLSLVYIPVYLDFRTAGQGLVRQLFPLSDIEKGDLEKWSKDRHAFEQLVHPGAGISSRISAVLAVLGPLLASIGAVLFK